MYVHMYVCSHVTKGEDIYIYIYFFLKRERERV